MKADKTPNIAASFLTVYSCTVLYLRTSEKPFEKRTSKLIQRKNWEGRNAYMDHEFLQRFRGFCKDGRP